MTITTRLAAIVSATALAFTLAACGSTSDSNAKGETTNIETNDGTIAVPKNPKRVVALDNRTFKTLADWGIKPVAAPRKIMPKTLEQKNDESITDLGKHFEPNLEAIVAAKPDIIINGQRFTQHQEKIKQLVPDTPIVNLDPREGKPFADELKRQTTTMGEIFGKQAEAKKLNADFDASIAKVKDAYDGKQTVMGVITTGGNINYSAPNVGRAVGPLFSMAGLKPALEVKDSSNDHQGDDVSVEAIAKANPDWIIVMDRDAAITLPDGQEHVPARDILSKSAALTKVKAVKNQHILYMPEDTYVNESIQTYTDVMNKFGEELQKQK